MDRRSLGLAPTFPRPTMRALLITACVIAIVPSAEAVSLPSISSSTGITMAVVSVALALSLLIGIVFTLREKIAGKLTNLVRWKKQAKQRNVETGQPTDIGLKGNEKTGQQENVETGQPTEIIPPQSFALEPQSSDPVEITPYQEDVFYFLRNWNSHFVEGKEDFIVDMVKEFPDQFTPSMMMNTLRTMLEKEKNTDTWMRMLRFVMMLERHLFKWDRPIPSPHPAFSIVPDVPPQTHQRFQQFLMEQADKILDEYGDWAKDGEGHEAGFMRFIAFLFGFVCRVDRILKLMDEIWTKFGYSQSDASRAMVWGYKNWKDTRVHGRTTDTKSDATNPNYAHFHGLMRELRVNSPVRVLGSSRIQHLLFALGCGYDPDPAKGPLAYMCDFKENSWTSYRQSDASKAKEMTGVEEKFTGEEYLWLMTGRDLVAGNAWQWMCKEGMAEHDRMVARFGSDERLYKNIVDMVMKYEQDYEEKGGQCMMSHGRRMGAETKFNVNFDEHRDWYERFKRYHWSVGVGINNWLKANLKPRPSKYNDEDE